MTDRSDEQRIRDLETALEELRGEVQGMQSYFEKQEAWHKEQLAAAHLERNELRDVIRELRARGTTVFINSHLLSEVEVTCDRVAFVKDGRVVRELTLGAEERAVEVEMRLERTSPTVLAGLARFGRDVAADGPRVRLRVDDETVLPEMTRWLAGCGVGLFHLAARRRTLEEVFLEVIGDVPVAG